MLRGLCPPQCHSRVQTLAEMSEVTNDPEELLKIMERESEKRKIA